MRLDYLIWIILSTSLPSAAEGRPLAPVFDLHFSSLSLAHKFHVHEHH